MDDLDELHRRMRIANLEARRELCEIERDALTGEINSSLTSEQARKAAARRRDLLWTEWVEIVEEMKSLLGSSRSRRGS